MLCVGNALKTNLRFFIAFGLLGCVATEERMTERAKRQLAAFTQTGSSVGPDLIMSCDISEEDYKQEDALVLNLRFAEDSSDILRSLKDQQSQIGGQIKEIAELFRQTHKEQARLLQLQNALRQQNAQMMALIGNSMKSGPNSGFIDDLFDIWRREEQEQEDVEVEEKLAQTTRSTPTARVVVTTPQSDANNFRYKNESIATGDQQIETDEVLSRSVFEAKTRREPYLQKNNMLQDDPLESIGTEISHQQESGEDEIQDTACQKCGKNEYCVIEENEPQCYPCTECIQGYSMTSPCAPRRDLICEDKNECTIYGHASTCREKGALCVNTPGGYLCLGGDASCIDDYYFNRRSSQCEPCSTCATQQHVIVPCSKFSDVICRTNDMEQQTDVWKGSLRKPNKLLKNVRELNEGCSLQLSDITENNQTIIEISKVRKRSSKNTTSARRESQNAVKLRRHGIIWVDFNMALIHSCRSFMQVGLFLSTPADSFRGESAVLDRTVRTTAQNNPSLNVLASTRTEYSLGDRYKFITLAAVAETQPNQELMVQLLSAHAGCVTSPVKTTPYYLRSVASNHKSGPFSVLWLSHDTGAVAYRAVTKNSAYGSLYAEFKQEYASDLHVVNLDHNGRYFVFKEPGFVLAKYHQALYTIGESCIEHGYSMICNVERSQGESVETLIRSHKSGVSYKDTATSLTVMASVDSGDRLSFDLYTPARCQVRYMSDLNLGVVNLVWVPRQTSAGILARLDHHDKIAGSVKSKVLTFVETENSNPAKVLLRSASYFEFKEAGRIHISYTTRIVHSCDYLKVKIHYVGSIVGSANSVEVARQVLGDTAGHWDGVSLGASHTVEAGSMCYATLTCIRGRIDEMSYGEWSTLSILWLPV